MHYIANMPHAPEEFVRVLEFIPDLVVDLRYASENNFVGQKVYKSGELWLRYGTVCKLMAVQEELRKMGLFLKVWDGFRPPAAQFRFWEILPDDTYVADPNQGFSNHSRGNTVDITLVDMDGNEIEMPTEFDDFSGRAERNHPDWTEIAAANSNMLEALMVKHGFRPYVGEWWHYADSVRYPVEHDFEPGK